MERPEPTVKVPRGGCAYGRLMLRPKDCWVKVREAKLGVADTAKVEVPEITMLDPAVNKEPISE